MSGVWLGWRRQCGVVGQEGGVCECRQGEHELCKSGREGVRVPGLPIRDCVASPNNRGPRWPKLSAIDVTVKTIFERLYLVSGLTPIYAPSQLSLCPHTPTAHSAAISRFQCNFFYPVAPHFFGQHLLFLVHGIL